ncbi:hypothetical protein ACFQH3_03585 [Haladaptatus sp. GCM10025707]|uniref:hypothetical protein n=1 Tax=unclassified Haladaptatus TaxID=2622732 RepID=UPI0023E85C4C|nr:MULTISPECIES: hypothetical protein [unclassified Haladaptatus]
MVQTESVTLPSSAWTTDRVRIAALAAIVGGVLYALTYLENTIPAISPGGSLYWLLGLVAITAYGLIAVGLWAVHSRFSQQYGRVGTALVYLITLTLATMIVGSAMNVLAPTLVDPTQEGATLGGTIWGLAMFATLILATGYGIVLWRAGVSRLGAGLLVVNLPLFIGGLVALSALGTVIGIDLAWLAFGAPFGAAWVALGAQLRADATPAV